MNNSPLRLHIPVGAGELFDKISILAIKSERITDPAKLRYVRRELALLEAVAAEFAWPDGLDDLRATLRTVNEQLWAIEDAIRECEGRGDFGPVFVELARSVYQTNDERARIKRQMDELCGSEVREEKSYRESSGRT